MATPTKPCKKDVMHYGEDVHWNNAGSFITRLSGEAPRATEPLKYEGEVDIGMAKPSTGEEDNVVQAANYMGIEGAPGLTQG